MVENANLRAEIERIGGNIAARVAARKARETEDVIRHRLQHYRDTREWRPSWGPNPARDA